MAVLILGGQGNLGTQLTKVFSEDYETDSWDREDCDFLDFPALTAKIKALRPAIIINAAAYNAVDKCENEEEYKIALKLNRDLPGVLADLVRELNAVLIHYSTDYVFSGTAARREFSENDIPNPVNKYGESKFQGEREILHRAERGLNYYLIRTSKLFGSRGASPQAKPSFFDIMLDLAQNKNASPNKNEYNHASPEELKIVDEELSCFTYTPDLAMATKRLWELETPFGIYHLINEGPVTWYEAALELFRLKKMKVAVRAVRGENLARPARRPKFSVLKNTKVRKMRDWKSALKEYLEIGK